MGAVLQPFADGDFETLYALDQACYPRGIAYSRSTLREFLSLPEADCLVARLEPNPRSPVTGFIIGESEGTLSHIITIDVAARYRRTGVGTALLEALERRLSKRGVRNVELETATTNAPGIAFWERHGYRKSGVLRGYYLGRLDAWKMRKTLPQLPQDNL
jgi:ribosomal-protein-alanine N-acetyltransferase